MDKKRLRVEEVAVLLNVSVKTINNWYTFKRENPEHQLSLLLPDFIQEGTRKTRYWTYNDIPKLAAFKAQVPRGRNGFMGQITQKYYHKKEESKKDGKKEIVN